MRTFENTAAQVRAADDARLAAVGQAIAELKRLTGGWRMAKPKARAQRIEISMTEIDDVRRMAGVTTNEVRAERMRKLAEKLEVLRIVLDDGERA